MDMQGNTYEMQSNGTWQVAPVDQGKWYGCYHILIFKKYIYKKCYKKHTVHI